LEYTNEQLIELYLSYLQKDKGCRRKTLEAYASDLKLFISAISDAPLLTLTEHDIRQYKYVLVSKKKAPRTINRKLSCLNSLYEYILNNEAYGLLRNPMRNIPKIKVPKTIPITLNENQAETFLNGILLTGKFGLRDYCIFLTFIFTAMRVSEVVNLTIHDLDFSKKLIHIKDGKGGVDRLIPMHPRLATSLLMYLTIDTVTDKQLAKINKFKCGRKYFVTDPENITLFLNRSGKKFTEKGIDYHFKNYMKKLGIYKQGLTLHALRRSCLTFLLEQGNDLFTIQQISGHSRVQSLEHYLAINITQVMSALLKHPLSNQGFDLNVIEMLRSNVN